MRHRNHSHRLSAKPDHSRMIQRNIVTSILLYERIRTTKKRAQVVKPLVDYIITIAKNDNTAVAIRRINQFVTDKNACRKAIEVLKDRYADRSSGYTRMVPVGMRKGDGAMLVDLELLEGKAVAPAEKNQTKQKNQKKQRNIASSKSSASSSSSASRASSKK